MINQLIAKLLPFIPRSIIWIFSKKYISGIKIEDALSESKKLNAAGCMVTIDILGEYIHKLSDAEKYKAQYLDGINQFSDNNINGNFSLKPSMFGLLLDKEVCYSNIREIVQLASFRKNFVRIDMEDSSCTEDEIELYRRLKKEFPLSVGLVLQAYMRRTFVDVVDMMDMHTTDSSLNFRLCKGIYIEDKSIAYKEFQEIRDNYLADLEMMLKNKIYVGIATHDNYLVEKSMLLIEELGISKDCYEFQMLFGVSPQLRRSIVEKGHAMRVYVPFGVEWFSYSTRRLKENPNMVWHIIKALFVRS